MTIITCNVDKRGFIHSFTLCQGEGPCFVVFFSNVPCLLRLFSMFDELPERLSMELVCVHWDRRD